MIQSKYYEGRGAEHVARLGEIRIALRILVGKIPAKLRFEDRRLWLSIRVY